MTQERIKNVLGEEIDIFVGWKWGDRYAWDLKFFTKNCLQCPWCISKEKAITIVQRVNSSKGRRCWLPPSEKAIMGLCDWGLRTQILYSTDKPIKCRFFGKKPSRA